MGYQKEGVYPHIQGPHSGGECNQIYPGWPLGCIWWRGQHCQGWKLEFINNSLSSDENETKSPTHLPPPPHKKKTKIEPVTF